MNDGKRFQQAVDAIQEHLSSAERALSSLGERLQFLVDSNHLEIVRRGPTGKTLRPKVVIAELKGCDPMLWQPEHPGWMRSLEHRSRSMPLAGKGGSEPPARDGGEEEDNPEPPVNAPKDS